MTSAEVAYLFRHAVLRDAAYQLQLPGDRARLHGLAFALIEALFGGRAPEPPRLDAGNAVPVPPHEADAVAAELADQARAARQAAVGAESEAFLAAERLYLRRAAHFLERRFQYADFAALWQRLAELAEGEAKGEFLHWAAHASWFSHRLGAAESLYAEAIRLARETGRRRAEGLALGDLASLFRQTGRVDEAERAHEQAIALHREVGNRRFEASALGNRANLFAETARGERAERLYGEAIAIGRGLGRRGEPGRPLGNLAMLFHKTGRIDLAERSFREALAAHRRRRNRRSEGIVLGNLSLLLGGTGRHRLAESAAGRSLAIAREVGDRVSEGISLANLGAVYRSTGRPEAAERAFRTAIAIHREVSDRRSEGVALATSPTSTAPPPAPTRPIAPTRRPSPSTAKSATPPPKAPTAAPTRSSSCRRAGSNPRANIGRRARRFSARSRTPTASAPGRRRCGGSARRRGCRGWMGGGAEAVVGG
ncbi:MAG: tetratricopeptide repeat protein [Planctomycetes bacterium]|nr:tetratricopeptide repeat protein [Planctomycetota bacterium]